MKILSSQSKFPTGVTLILGFFDGIHAGHREVIKQAKALNNETLLVTFPKSPAEFFENTAEYIYPRSYSYKLIEKFGVDSVLEIDFKSIAKESAKDFLDFLIKNFSPKSIVTGFNYTFGANKQGDTNYLKQKSSEYNYEYFCTPPYIANNSPVSSTRIKSLLKAGNITTANELLCDNFILESTVINGEKLGRKIGFPTANFDYPQEIVKLPYGVYKTKVLNKLAVMNWGIKPTVSGEKSCLEVHIPNHNENLYGQTLQIEILERIRDEKKFESIEELKIQIKKDIETCLK